MKIKEKFYGIEEKLGEYILAGWSLLGASGAVEMAVNKTAYLKDIYLPGAIPALAIGSLLYIHANLRKPKEKQEFSKKNLERILHGVYLSKRCNGYLKCGISMK
jgi:hypothetical protein